MQRGWFARLSAWAAIGVSVGLWAQPATLNVERRGDEFRLSAPQLHFIQGRLLERLHDGASLTYVLSVRFVPHQGDGRPVHVEERFIVSYDLWEETFEVVRPGTPRLSASRLSAGMVEEWCVDHLRVPIGLAPVDTTFVLRLECVVPEDAPGENDEGSGLTLTALIDRLSRKAAREAPARWEAASGPLRLRDLKDSTGR